MLFGFAQGEAKLILGDDRHEAAALVSRRLPCFDLTLRGKSKGHGNHERVMARMAAKTAVTQPTNTTFITQPCASVL